MPKEIAICSECKVEFLRYKHDSKFCSSGCKTSHDKKIKLVLFDAPFTRGVNLINQVVGKLTAVSYAGKSFYKKGQQKPENVWYCKCECGGEKYVTTGQFRAGGVQSCGCLKRQQRRYIDPKVRNFMATYKRGAKERNLSFQLTERQFEVLITTRCHYCNVLPKQDKNTTRKEKHALPPFRNGIDRTDPKLGYMVDNCVPCCTICNTAKGSLPYQEFMLWIDRVTKHQIKIHIFNGTLQELITATDLIDRPTATVLKHEVKIERQFQDVISMVQEVPRRPRHQP